MMRAARSRRVAIAASVAAVLAATGGCGSLEWPPPGRVPRAVNAPPPASPAPAPPAPQSSSPAFVAAGVVIAGHGDTVYALSRRHRVPVRAIIEANKLKPPYHLNEGQRVELPRGPTYMVQRGDTLYAVARDRRVDPYALARLNGLKPPYVIQTGETLVLPERTPAAAEQATPPQTAKAPTLPGTPPIAEQQLAPPAASSASAAAPPAAAAPSPPAISGSGFIWPVKGRLLSSFGSKAKGLRNDGVNIAARRGTPVMASEHGVVAYAGNELRGFGNLLLIKHEGGWITAYAHNETILVKRGERVERGQQIATVGATGNVRSPQLHFELRRGRIAEDPEKHLQGA